MIIRNPISLIKSLVKSPIFSKHSNSDNNKRLLMTGTRPGFFGGSSKSEEKIVHSRVVETKEYEASDEREKIVEEVKKEKKDSDTNPFKPVFNELSKTKQTIVSQIIGLFFMVWIFAPAGIIYSAILLNKAKKSNDKTLKTVSTIGLVASIIITASQFFSLVLPSIFMFG